MNIYSAKAQQNIPLVLNKPKQGFTLIELVMVMVLLGVMAVGITGFMGLATQTYVNVTARDELIASARFAIERLNREIRNAVPNSIRVKDGLGWHCIEFVPIAASTTYIDIPLESESPSKELMVIPFKDSNDQPYTCDSTCRDLVTVYPLNHNEIYNDVYTSSLSAGKVFWLNKFDVIDANSWKLTLNSSSGVQFSNDSPTKRLYIMQSPISYCAHNTRGLWRFDNYTVTKDQKTPTTIGNKSLMAENLVEYDEFDPVFLFENTTLQRNALVRIKLAFENNDENITFENEIHINNVP